MEILYPKFQAPSKIPLTLQGDVLLSLRFFLIYPEDSSKYFSIQEDYIWFCQSTWPEHRTCERILLLLSVFTLEFSMQVTRDTNSTSHPFITISWTTAAFQAEGGGGPEHKDEMMWLPPCQSSPSSRGDREHPRQSWPSRTRAVTGGHTVCCTALREGATR